MVAEIEICAAEPRDDGLFVMDDPACPVIYVSPSTLMLPAGAGQMRPTCVWRFVEGDGDTAESLVQFVGIDDAFVLDPREIWAALRDRHVLRGEVTVSFLARNADGKLVKVDADWVAVDTTDRRWYLSAFPLTEQSAPIGVGQLAVIPKFTIRV